MWDELHPRPEQQRVLYDWLMARGAGVLTGDSFGVYSGGGFLLTSSRPGRSTFGGPIRDATLQLITASPGFVDQLGHSVFTGSISARRDEELAARIRDAMSRIVATGTSR